MKKIYFIFFIIILTAVMCMTSGAKNGEVIDNADLLTDSEELWLLSEIDSIREEYDFTIVVLAEDSIGDKSPREYADDYYDENGYSDNGMLFLLSMEERDWHISTKGSGITAFTDYRIESIGNIIVGSLSNADYYGAFSEFLSLSEYYLRQNAEGDPFDIQDEPIDFTAPIVISFVLAVIIALIVSGLMRRSMKTIRPQTSAVFYLDQNGLILKRNDDMFLYSRVTKVRKPTESSSGGGRGGSSTHRSSSGSSHGGRGGKF